LETVTAGTQFLELTKALNAFPSHRVVFTKANADTDGRIINGLIEEYVARNSERCRVFTSMGQMRYLSTMKYARAVVGNSSSGIVEAPSFQVPTVNIGDRQKGRVRVSVIDCEPHADDIRKAIMTATHQNFGVKTKEVVNPYEGRETSACIASVLKSIDLTNLGKKEFYECFMGYGLS